MVEIEDDDPVAHLLVVEGRELGSHCPYTQRCHVHRSHVELRRPQDFSTLLSIALAGHSSGHLQLGILFSIT